MRLELARRAHPEDAARVHLVVVLEAAIELGPHGGHVGSGVKPDVVAFDPRDRLVKARGPGTTDRDPPDQHHARLGAWAENDTSPVQAALKTLAQESTEEASDETMLEMDLNDVFGIPAIRQHWRLERDRPQ